MKSSPLALLLALTGLPVAAAATPEADYIAARDAAIAKLARIEAKNPGADTSKLDQQALKGLEGRLASIIGGLSITPYPATGKIAFDTLSKNEVGSGGLDALRFSTADGSQQVTVTTDGLLARWLSKPEDWWRKTSKTPPPIEAALANPEFYTYAVGVDAALTKTVDLTVATPAGAADAHALLGGWAQDVGPNPEQEIVVALRKGGKLFIAQEKARSYRPIPACEAIWTEAQRKADATYKSYADGGARDQKLMAAYDALQGDADKAYRACYAERLPRAEFYPALAKEAQAVADRFRGE
ncbi:MAG: hypothetical protein ACR652_07380 [Methylocystis sp.]|uniref:hypothetical protein n=1 Tax=Methylocystis sp. TaxID=1911079 RepID=UPI003DA5EFDD